jgi:Ca-activated chloride channel family protein
MKALDYEEAAPYAEYGLGSVYLALGEEQAALNRFAEAKTLLEAFPAAVSGELRYRINYNTGVVLFSEGNFSAAADSFRDALRADSGKLEAKRNLELSIRSFTRENRFIGGDGGESESESKTALFEYVRQKELNHWKSREWPQEEDTQGLDY